MPLHAEEPGPSPEAEFAARFARTSGLVSHEREVQAPSWATNATIYEVNIRQFSPEGTFAAFTEQLPRLKDMGIDIIWLMPIHPIGEEKRKGSLGSYYAVADFLEVNPEFGTADDFRALVQAAHALGMRVIIDWVANHTAWDNVWMQSNPDFYARNESGNFYPPVEDWSDVVQLDYDNPELREAMWQALEFWVAEYDIDGYRCDVAYMVPTDFWDEARRRLDAIKPVFMLAEAEDPEHHIRAFDMSYAWEYAHVIREVGAGRMQLDAIDTIMAKDIDRFDRRDYRMYFTSNHDENSWKGSDLELYGDNFQNFAVLSATIYGMPLVYNGQEAGLDKQLDFFEKDAIVWGDLKYEDFYRTLLHLNRRNQALWNGKHGGIFHKVATDKDDRIYAYQRIGEDDQVMVMINFSDQPESFTLQWRPQGEWVDVFSGEAWSPTTEVTLPAHSHLVLERS